VNIVPFIAESAADAVAQIREQLGCAAVVVNVRKLPPAGLARLWQKPRIEVLAYVPEPAPEESDPLAALKQEFAELKQQLAAPAPVFPPLGSALPPPTLGVGSGEDARRGAPNWRAGAMLESMGVLPVYAQRVVEHLRARHGDQPPAMLAEELAMMRLALCQMWNKSEPECQEDEPPTHVLVGPPGVGKTTCLCKWLAQETLLWQRQARVWRLDGQVANTAALIEVYGEILGVPVERFRPKETDSPPDQVRFVDLPGVPANDTAALTDLAEQLEQVPGARVHLVLNAAYEVPVLLGQVRAFSPLPLQDIVLTHLDEETRWGKLWNLVLGTNYSLRFLSAGQNIPGDFRAASAELLLARVFP